MNMSMQTGNDFGVSGAEFARIVGRDPALISRWKRAGKLVLDAADLILVEASRARLGSLLHAVHGGRRRGEPAPPIMPAQALAAVDNDQCSDTREACAALFALGWATAINVLAGGDGRAVDIADIEAGGQHYFKGKTS